MIPSPQERLRLIFPNITQTLALHPTSALPTSSQTPDLAEFLDSPRGFHVLTFQDFEFNSSGSNYLLGIHSNPLLHQLHRINSNPFFLILNFNCRTEVVTTLLILP